MLCWERSGLIFFKNSLPESLWEAAQIDGCGTIRYFFQFALPLSKAVLAVIGLWTAVGLWNSWFNALIYISDETLQPLQLLQKNLDYKPVIVGGCHGNDGTGAKTALRHNEERFSSHGLSIQVKGNLSIYQSIWRYGEELHDLGGTARTLDMAAGALLCIFKSGRDRIFAKGPDISDPGKREPYSGCVKYTSRNADRR